MTVNADIFDGLSLWLENEQPFSPALRIAAQRVTFVPRNGETYLQTQFLPNQTDSDNVGEGTDHYQGIFQVNVVFEEQGTGIIAPQEIADAIVSLFKKGTLIDTAEGRRIKIYRTGWVSPLVPDSSRPMIPVSIPYSLVEPNA